jgi:hypothetical protein
MERDSSYYDSTSIEQQFLRALHKHDTDYAKFLMEDHNIHPENIYDSKKNTALHVCCLNTL